ncbi:hypothetical protein QLX08_007306 [Tetragonisca angustula]|uniref:Uncharacterized protein n=1 Tax=Tetragonisca angustula TaxID=166442 RepID=A0AAW0ZQ39_9HYME
MCLLLIRHVKHLEITCFVTFPLPLYLRVIANMSQSNSKIVSSIVKATIIAQSETTTQQTTIEILASAGTNRNGKPMKSNLTTMLRESVAPTSRLRITYSTSRLY